MAVNWYYIFALVVISCGSIPKGKAEFSSHTFDSPSLPALTDATCSGYDEGGFSASVGLMSFKQDFGLLSSQWKNNPAELATRIGNIKSFGVLGAACGTLIALLLNDRLGRLRTWQFGCLMWMSGLFMQMFASGIYGFELFARIWGGLGAGVLTVAAPLYLTEIAPAKSRGMVVTLYMVFLLSFLMFGKSTPISDSLTVVLSFQL